MRRKVPLLVVCVLAAMRFATAAAPTESEVRNGYFTTSDGVRLHYLEAGRGPAIVFELREVSL